MNQNSKFRRQDSVAGRRIAGESFLVPVCGSPVDMESIFVLNPVGDFIWQRLDGMHTLQAIHDEMMENFEVTAEQARADAADFIGQLLERGLIVEMA
jgi:hypothetical protein